jgi:DNA-binding CsgD family transcriptional regulator/tetratricopeptide (TPR) repeat protein
MKEYAHERYPYAVKYLARIDGWLLRNSGGLRVVPVDLPGCEVRASRPDGWRLSLYAGPVLQGRERERERITTLIDEAWASRGGALVLLGQPGVGKSTLLLDARERAEGMQILSTRGIESESPLAFAALQRLLKPVMRYAERLPHPQSAALRAAFGEQAGGGDRFLVFLAALSLLAEAAEQSPMLCVIDDAHWLDDASAAALLFVARRLGPERVAVLFAARTGDMRRFEGEDLPELTVGGLDDAAAQALLSEQVDGPLSVPLRERILAQAGGNPLALVELPHALSAAQLSGAEPLPPQLPLTEEVQRVFLDRARHLSAGAQTVLLVAAADDSTRLAVIRGALAALGVDAAPALEEIERSGLLQVTGGHVELRHPLVRSAVYQGATSSARQQVHAALAEAMTGIDPDRRAWHLAAATDEPDDVVVAELEGAAERAHQRGGHEAASAALERAAELSADDASHARRLFAAATHAWLAGQLGRARPLADSARQLTADPLLRADADRLRGRIEFNIGSVATAIRILTGAARSVAVTDPGRAREIGMMAMALSAFAAPDARTDLDPSEVASDSAGNDPRDVCFTGLLFGFHHLLRGDLPSAAPALRSALEAGRDLTETDLLTNKGIAAFHLGEDDAFRRAFAQLLSQSREAGALGLVLFALPRLALADLSAGRWGSATADATEALQLARGTGQPALTAMPLAELALYAALRGDDNHDALLGDLDQVMSGPPTGILGELVHDSKRWAQGVRELFGGQPASAVHHLEQMTQPPLIRLAAYDRLEAAVRAGRPDLAQAWLEDLELFAAAVGSPRSRAVAAYGQALLAPSDAAEALFRQSLGHSDKAGRPFEAARIHLAFGEFLRRVRRRVDAREDLRTALTIFEEVGATPWADRARQELRASGETARKRDESTATDLTPQERQVARHVAEGLSNRDVAAQLFLSPRTIDFHLRNVFAKTGISSRGELGRLNLDQ